MIILLNEHSQAGTIVSGLLGIEPFYYTIFFEYLNQIFDIPSDTVLMGIILVIGNLFDENTFATFKKIVYLLLIFDNLDLLMNALPNSLQSFLLTIHLFLSVGFKDVISIVLFVNPSKIIEMIDR